MKKNHSISATVDGKSIDFSKRFKLSVELISPRRNFVCFVRLKKLTTKDIETATGLSKGSQFQCILNILRFTSVVFFTFSIERK